MIRILNVGLFLCLIVGCGSESFTEIETTRSPLFPGFHSYAPRAEVMAKLSREVKVEVVEQTSLAQGDSTPPYRIYTMSIAPYPHLGQPGKLHMTFYNDRLLQTAFYPQELDDYVKALRNSGVAVEFGQELVKGNTVIWIGIDFDNKHYVGWADQRLREQQRRWLARYR
jgi:hypothetical protein